MCTSYYASLSDRFLFSVASLSCQMANVTALKRSLDLKGHWGEKVLSSINSHGHIYAVYNAVVGEAQGIEV